MEDYKFNQLLRAREHRAAGEGLGYGGYITLPMANPLQLHQLAAAFKTARDAVSRCHRDEDYAALEHHTRERDTIAREIAELIAEVCG